MIGTTLFLLFATAVTHTDSNDTYLDDLYENGCPKDTTIPKLLPHENCSKYYKCHHGGLISRSCPNGLHFNAEKERCEWIAKCQAQLMREKNIAAESNYKINIGGLEVGKPIDEIKICQSPESTGILIAHENCNEFFKCSYGRPVALRCARNLLYNTISEKCDWPHNVDCGERKIVVKDDTIEDVGYPYLSDEIDRSNSDPRLANAICANKNSDGVVVAHEHCNRFYKCVAGVPYSVKCPINLLYNPIKEHCDWPRKVNCEGRIVPEDEEKKTTETQYYDYDENNKIEILSDSVDSVDSRLSKRAIDVCAAENSEGNTMAHELCSHFYKCTKGEAIAFHCPGNLLYNSKKNYCDWPKKVECGYRAVGGDSNEGDSSEDRDDGNLRQALTVCSGADSDDLMIGHESCNKYYQCHEGTPVEVECAPNLLYNPETESCDWPTYVDCKDRTTNQ